MSMDDFKIVVNSNNDLNNPGINNNNNLDFALIFQQLERKGHFMN